MRQSDVVSFLGAMQNHVTGGALEELSAISTMFTVPKGTVLMEEGKRHPYFYLLVQGSAKSYQMKGGRMKCKWFAFEGEVLATMGAFEDGVSDETIEVLEDSTLIQLSSMEFAQLAECNREVGHLGYAWLTGHAQFLERQVQLNDMSAHARYKTITESEPQLLQRVSLSDLASFLGMTKETLSRVRGKI